MNIYKKQILISILFLFIVVSVSAEDGCNYLDNGVALFRIGEYEKSIDNFKKVIVDQSLKKNHADAYFWLSKACIAIRRLDDAEENLEHYLLNNSKHKYYEEAQYQKGRLLFLQRDFENCILECKNFIETFPGSVFIPNAYFWLGESLYTLGRLEDAEKIFLLIKEEYPASFKVKDAKYRLLMIEQKYREESLIELLKLTHEENYKAIEELQLREKTYENAIASFQEKLIANEPLSGALRENEVAPSNEMLELKKELGNKEVEISALKNKIAELEYRLEDYNNAPLPSENNSYNSNQTNSTLSQEQKK